MTKPVALLLIDVQEGFHDPVWGTRNNPGAENSIKDLLTLWRGRNQEVIHVRHSSINDESPLRPHQIGFEFMKFAEPLPHERIFTKHVNSAFIGTDLENYLRNNYIEDLVVAGFVTDHCVSTTVRMAANLGFRVAVVSDATATFERVSIDKTHFPAQLIHETALASLNGEFAKIISSEDLRNLC